MVLQGMPTKTIEEIFEWHVTIDPTVNMRIFAIILDVALTIVYKTTFSSVRNTLIKWNYSLKNVPSLCSFVNIGITKP